MTEFKMNPKNLRYFLFVPLGAIIWFLNPPTAFNEIVLLLLLTGLLILFLVLHYQTTFQVTADSYIYKSVFKKQLFDKQQHRLRAIGSKRVGSRHGRSTIYQINIIDRKSLLTVKELRLNMTSTQYDTMCATLRKLNELNG